MKEEWLWVNNYPHYEVSNLGNVRSWKLRNGREGFAKSPMILKNATITGKDYLKVILANENGRKDFRVHLLVIEAFVGKRPLGFECRHLDGNAKNNRVDNLVWGSHLENISDQLIHGTRLMGEQISLSVLTNEQVKDIKDALSNGKHGIGRSLAKQFGVGDSTISAIKRERTWRHI